MSNTTKKTTAKKATAPKKAKVLVAYMRNMKKSDTEILEEVAKDNLDNLIWECKAQISHIETALIPPLELKVQKAERAVTNANKDYKLCLTNLSTGTFKHYLRSLNEAVDKKEEAQAEKALAERTIKGYEKEVERLKGILLNLTA